jgi:patatin-related protein
MATSPQADYKKEVRFAVVMYGGVSLAIYINGVTQELFRLVRSTAAAGSGERNRNALSGSPDCPPEFRLTGTERTYRKLSHLLSDDNLLLKCQQLAKEAETDPQKVELLKDELEKLVTDDTKPVRTGFIVDILSGTSAGGINSIYLAKALANEQRIDRLKQLWIDEGDIELLLNDSRSIKGISLDLQDPPHSLLNGRRMYFKLLKALDDMDRDAGDGKPKTSRFEDTDRDANAKPKKACFSPYIKELDLFITATDIEGVAVPLKLTDKLVYERRHRNVFHFEYQKTDEVNDFEQPSNPFLAFAARCTSSFPFAFEPMRLCDMDEVLQLFPNYRDKPEYSSDSIKWQRYFREVLDPRTGIPNLKLARRSFGDGGYLDNKPFSYAIEALVRRQSDVPVERKLIYIGPSPEHPEDVPERDFKPDALQNVKTALLDLPTYEAIREDLQRVLQRNHLIERVQRIISAIEKDVKNDLQDQFDTKLSAFANAAPEQSSPEPLENQLPMWSQRNLTRVVEDESPSLRALSSYRLLRVAAVTDDIARLIARLLNIDANSDLLLPLRCLVRVWRDKHYPNKKALYQFLSDFDFSHRIRRLTVIRERIDRLYDFSWSTREELLEYGDQYEEQFGSKLASLSPELEARFRSKHADIGWILGLLRSSRALSQLEVGQRQELRNLLIFMKCEVNKVYKDMQSKARLLRQRRSQARSAKPGEFNPVLKPIEDIGITADLLKEIINPEKLEILLAQKGLLKQGHATPAGTVNEDECLLLAKDFMEQHSNDDDFAGKIKTAAIALQTELNETITNARHRIGVLFNPKERIEAESVRGQEYLRDKDRATWFSSDEVKAVREYLAYYYYNFEEYDRFSFPIYYQADIGEASTVEVIRVSPEDATSLIDEREEARNSPHGKGRQKLAGVSLHHFGAFLDRTWRQNDIMWGRLDGLERLITALLPGEQNKRLRGFLIDEGNTSILIDELPPESRLQLGGIVSEALVRASAGEPMEAAVTKVTRGLTDHSPVRTRLEAVIRSSLNNQELMEFIKYGYEINRKLDPKPLLTSISRSTQIIGKVFEDIANANQLDGKSLAWIARLGQLFWGLVEVAVPNTLRNMLWNRWLSIVYAFELFTIVGGLLLSSQAAQQFGWTALGITVALNVLVLVLKDIMRGRQAVYRATGVLVCLVILSLALLGLLEILGPLFGVKLGSQNLYPMFWLKENVKNAINWIPSLWLRENLVTIVLLAAVGVLVLALNLFFGLLDFSWMDRGWKLFWKWLKQCKLRSVVPWIRFKPIKLVIEELDKRARQFPGTEDIYLPLSLSEAPSNFWIKTFEESFRKQQLDQQKPAQRAAVNQHQLLVVSSAAELSHVGERLENALTQANSCTEKELHRQRVDDFAYHKRLMGFGNDSNKPDGQPTLPDPIQEQIESLRTAAARKLGNWTVLSARAIGVLLLLMSFGILFTLITNETRFLKYPHASLPGGLHNPGLALQLAHNKTELNQIVRAEAIIRGVPETDSEALNFTGRSRLREKVLLDWFVILYYTITLGLLSYWLSLQRQPTEKSIAAAAVLLVFLTAFFDILENNRILTVLGQNPVLDQSVQSVRMFSTLKWAALFVVLGLLGRVLWSRKYRWLRWNGFALLVTSLIGVLGLIKFRIAIEGAFWLIAFCLVPLGLFFIWQPRGLARK